MEGSGTRWCAGDTHKSAEVKCESVWLCCSEVTWASVLYNILLCHLIGYGFLPQGLNYFAIAVKCEGKEERKRKRRNDLEAIHIISVHIKHTTGTRGKACWEIRS